MKKPKKTNPFLRILTILFVVYLSLFISQKAGYYEKYIKDKTTMTSEQIQKFEADVSAGKQIDLKSYLKKEEDYSNFWTKSANAIERRIALVLENDVKGVWDFLKTLFIG